MELTPVPSSSSSTRTSLSLVARSTRAALLIDNHCSLTEIRQRFIECGDKPSVLFRSPHRYPKPPCRPGFSDQHPAIHQLLTYLVPIGEDPEQAEVGIARCHVKAAVAKGSNECVPLVAQNLQAGLQFLGMRQGHPGNSWGDQREVVGQSHDAKRVDDRRMSRRVADTGTGHGESLAHRPGNDHI